MSLYEIKYNKNYLPTVRMGVIIENNSNEDKSVWFLGTKKNNYKEMDGVSISNMFSDTFLDDNSLTMLKNWLISKGQIIIAVTRITADGNIHDAMGNNLVFNEGGVGGQMGNIRISSYFSPHQFTHSIIDISDVKNNSINKKNSWIYKWENAIKICHVDEFETLIKEHNLRGKKLTKDNLMKLKEALKKEFNLY